MRPTFLILAACLGVMSLPVWLKAQPVRDLQLMTEADREALRAVPGEIRPSAELAFGRAKFTSDVDGILWLNYTAQPICAGKPFHVSIPASFTWRFVDKDSFFIGTAHTVQLTPEESGQEKLFNIRLAEAYDRISRQYAEQLGIRRILTALDKEFALVPGNLEDGGTQSAFEMGRYEIRVEQYQLFHEIAGVALEEWESPESIVTVTSLRAVPERQKGIDYRYRPDARLRAFDEEREPVVFVTRGEAETFCQWLSQVDSRFNYRLPTMKEWQYAARAAGAHTQYPWPAAAPIAEYANYAEQTLAAFYPDRQKGFDLQAQDGHAFTAPVGSFKPNAIGLYDMGGNVAEWIADTIPNTKKYGLPQGYACGGSFASEAAQLAIGQHEVLTAAARHSRVGFRIVREPK